MKCEYHVKICGYQFGCDRLGLPEWSTIAKFNTMIAARKFCRRFGCGLIFKTHVEVVR